MSLLRVDDVCFHYDGITAVHHISFSVERGDCLVILGENGAGKTTLMHGLLGLKKASKGTITFGDGLNSRQIGYLPQQTVVQKDFPASVYEVVLSGCGNRLGWKPFFTKAEKLRAEKSMETLGITALTKRCYRELSGGQQQRVLLARALCATESLLLLDEPAAGLDPIITHELYEIISRINRERGVTVIMISHDVDSAVRYATHVLQLGTNQKFFGTKDEYIASDYYKLFTEVSV